MWLCTDDSTPSHMGQGNTGEAGGGGGSLCAPDTPRVGDFSARQAVAWLLTTLSEIRECVLVYGLTAA